jgi:hypothetical protein
MPIRVNRYASVAQNCFGRELVKDGSSLFPDSRRSESSLVLHTTP